LEVKWCILLVLTAHTLRPPASMQWPLGIRSSSTFRSTTHVKMYHPFRPSYTYTQITRSDTLREILWHFSVPLSKKTAVTKSDFSRIYTFMSINVLDTQYFAEHRTVMRLSYKTRKISQLSRLIILFTIPQVCRQAATLKTVWSYTSTPLCSFPAGYKMNFTFTFEYLQKDTAGCRSCNKSGSATSFEVRAVLQDQCW
jgi:hypothetical protein